MGGNTIIINVKGKQRKEVQTTRSMTTEDEV